MSDWQDEWWRQIEKTAADMEGFFAEVGEATELLVDEVGDSFGSLFQQFEASFGKEVEDFIHNFVDVIVTTSDDIEAALWTEWDEFSEEDFTRVSYHDPSADSNPACIGCSNYHGQAYNGNLLVCAMHPQGYADSNCPDWLKD
ncbi:MAG: hypothetical protein AAFQ41_08115 [Cyanobacteria bacterium J06623_7]